MIRGSSVRIWLDGRELRLAMGGGGSGKYADGRYGPLTSLGCIIDTGRGREERLALGPSGERVVALLVGVPCLEKLDPGEVISWVEAVLVLEVVSTASGE